MKMKVLGLILLLISFSQSLFCHLGELVKKHLPIENPIILDCGAHNGDTASYWKKIFPKSTILAVEGDPHMSAILFQKVKTLEGVHPFHLILSNVDGMVKFYPNLPGPGSRSQGSLYKENVSKNSRGKLSDKPITVESRTLDTFCKENGIDKIDFLFLDMQGGELQMLKASKTILPKVTFICTEVLFAPLYVDAPLYSEVDTFLKSQGFVQVGIHKKSKWADAYYVRKA